MKNPTYIDLFAGAGGLSEGFIQAGFEPIAHVEMDTAAAFTLKTRAAYHYLTSIGQSSVYEAYLKGEIKRTELYNNVPAEVLSAVINLPIGGEFNSKIHSAINQQINDKEIDLIIGGPPCQAYSLVGRARDKHSMARDPRNYLYVQYARYLETYNPKMFVFENVLGLKSAKGGHYLYNMERLFNKKGYNIQLFVVEANNFGVLQNRKRIIIIGWKNDFIPNLPNLEHIRVDFNAQVNDLFDDLPFLNAGGGIDKYQHYQKKTNPYLTNTHIRNGSAVLTQHITRPNTEQDKEIYRIAVNEWNEKQLRLNYNELPDRLKTHQNRESFFDRFKVVAGNLAHSQTVVAHIAKDGHYYIHPDIKQNRSISIREAARLQSFPDNYYFEGMKEISSRTAPFKQIGNAVPPLMAYSIANRIKNCL